MAGTTIEFAPLLPWIAVIALGVAAALLAGIGLYVRAGQMRVKPGTSNDACRGQLGDSTEPFVIRTTHGVIRFTVKHNPKPHGIFHMD